MRIKDDVKDLGVCIGFFAAGWLYLACYQKVEGDVLRSSVEFLSFIATIAAAVFAVYALNAWKRQFTQSEGFAALSRLVSSVDQMLVASVYIRGCAQYEHAMLLPDGDPMKQQWLDEERSSFNDWAVAFNNYYRDLDDVRIFIRQDRLSGYLANPRSLSERFIKVTDEIRREASLSDSFGNGPVFFKAILSSKSFESEIVKIRTSVQRLRESLVRD